MPTLRSAAVFGFLYVAVLLACQPMVHVPGLRAIVYAAAGFLAVSPFDRVGALWLWIWQSPKRAREYRTCAISSPVLGSDRRDRRFIGTVRGVR